MKEQLTEISQKAQAENIDLWPEIYAELKETKTVKKPVLNHQWARFAAAFSLFFISALVVYAVSRISVDSGLEGERAERLVTPVNQSITFDEFTIRLDWAYADVNRIVFGYSFLDAEGNIFQPENDVFSYKRMLSIREVTPRSARNFRTSLMSTSYEHIDYNPALEQQVFSWTPYFDYEGNVLTELSTVEIDLRIQLYGQTELYRFLVEIPIYPAQFATTEGLMDGETVDIVVRELTITPSLTNLIFCFYMPGISDNRLGRGTMWEAVDFNLYFDNQSIYDLYPDLTGEVSSWVTYQDEYCTIANLAIPSDVLPETVRLEVYQMHELIYRYTEEQGDLLAQLYEERGLDFVMVEILGDDNQGLGEYSFYSEELYGIHLMEKHRLYNEIMRIFYDSYPEIPRLREGWTIEFELQDPVN